MTKICTKCKNEKSLDQFFVVSRKYKNPRINKDRRNTICKSCICERTLIHRSQHKEQYAEIGRNWTKKNPEKRKIIMKRYWESPKGVYGGLIKRGKEYVLVSQKDFIEWYLKQEKKCFYCDIPESLVKKFTGNKMSKCKRLTIDKINPHGFYELNNIVLACGVCNLTKNDVFTKDEMLKVGKIIKIKWKKLYD